MTIKLPEKVHGKNNLVAYMTTNHSLTAGRGRVFMICCHIMTKLIYKIIGITCRCKKRANAPPVFLLPKNCFSGYCIEKWGKQTYKYFPNDC
jgi:hypothetical protein